MDTSTVNEQETGTEPEQETEVVEPRLKVRISSDRLQVVLDAEDPLADLENSVEKILAQCRDLGVSPLPEAEALAALLQAEATAGEEVGDLVLMSGRAPVKPVNGRLEWSHDYFASGWAIDEKTGAIDFWERIDHRNVLEGDLLVTVLAPVEGTPGLDVQGNPISVDKPKTAKIRCGKGVHQDSLPEGLAVYASRHGKIRFNDGTVAVDDVLVIKGDVSLETGNIHHNGAVIVEGDVREGATIQTEGDIEVKGLLEPCNIQAGGGLTVDGGIIGDEDHLIQVGGQVLARYIRQAVIRAEGDVLVVREINHSDVATRGKVDVSQGRIAGGRTLARKGIFVAEAGAGGGPSTELIAGVDTTLGVKLKHLRDRTGRLETARDSIQTAVREYETRTEELTEAQNRLLTGLRAKITALADAIRQEEAREKDLLERARRQAHLEIEIYKEVWSGTIIQLGKRKTHVRSSVFKPRIARLHGKDVMVLPMGEDGTPQEDEPRDEAGKDPAPENGPAEDQPPVETTE